MTGATGLIGGAVARRLKARGDEIVALARSDASATKLAGEGFTVAHGDLAAAESVAEAAAAADAVVHAASPSDQNAAVYDEAATHAIINALRGTGKRFVYTSGCLLCGPTGDTPATEDSPLNPVDLARDR